MQFATALARLHSLHGLTILVIDSGGWNWGEGLFDWFAPFGLISHIKCCWLVLIENWIWRNRIGRVENCRDTKR